MIVCTECAFENPKDHRFCQQCGAPLSVWRVVITEGVEKLQTTLHKGDFLDSQHRYQLLEDVVVTNSVAEALVSDTQPEQETYLIKGFTAEERQQLTSGPLDPATFPASMPESARSYLTLQERFFPSVPELHDAWVTEDSELILIEDRGMLPRLADIWGQATLEPLQQVHGLYTMIELWESLVTFQGQASLLKLDNLCVDEDQIFCLRRIDCSHTPTSHTLQDLGLLWQSLLHSAKQVPDELFALVGEVSAGTIDSMETLRDQLVAIADHLQSESVTAADDALMSPGEASDEVSSTAKGLKTPLDMLEQLGLEDSFDDASDFDDDDSPDMATMVLPMKLIGLEEGGLTHVGQQRDHNEDAFFIQSALKRQDGIQGQKLEAKSLYILCDGMGGHAGGEVASRLAVETLQAYFEDHWTADLPDETQLREAISLANQAIYNRNLKEERSGSARMGTTLVLMLINNTHGIVAHVGDSRLYRYSRRLGLQQVTTDHEVGQREIQRGIEPAIAYARPDAYQLTQALGPRDQSDLDPGITYLNLTEDTLFILCSDGLSDHDLLETNCKTHIEPMLKGPKNIEEGIADLIDLANEINGHDNITALAVKLKVKPNLEQMKANYA